MVPKDTYIVAMGKTYPEAPLVPLRHVNPRFFNAGSNIVI